jgi:hypothetical protein
MELGPSWIEKLRQAEAERVARNSDPWRLRLVARFNQFERI